MQTVGDRTLDKLKELIGVEINKIRDVLDGPNAHFLPIDTHRYMVGQIHGLRAVVGTNDAPDDCLVVEAINAVTGEGAPDRQRVTAGGVAA